MAKFGSRIVGSVTNMIHEIMDGRVYHGFARNNGAEHVDHACWCVGVAASPWPETGQLGISMLRVPKRAPDFILNFTFVNNPPCFDPGL